MENRKNLQINCAHCDARGVTEEALAPYESITVNCAMLFSTARASALLAQHGAQINTAKVINLPENARVSLVNGSLSLRPGQLAEEGTFLLVNGQLDIEPGCEEVLKRYSDITVNGAVSAPESMAGLLAACSINGATDLYPDGCIRLGNQVTLDGTFALRARQNAVYYVRKHIVALADGIDFAKLAEKNVHFITKKLFVAQSLAEAALPLFDEKAEIEILPDGCAFVNDDLTLDESALHLHGGRIYVRGDVTLPADGPWLDELTFLRVDGDLVIVRGLEKRVRALGVQYKSLQVEGGLKLQDKEMLALTRALLESAENGLSIADCATVNVAEDASPALLREKLVRMQSCGRIVCTNEQAAVIERVANDIDRIGPDAAGEETADEDEPGADTVQINTASYTF